MGGTLGGVILERSWTGRLTRIGVYKRARQSYNNSYLKHYSKEMKQLKQWNLTCAFLYSLNICQGQMSTSGRLYLEAVYY